MSEKQTTDARCQHHRLHGGSGGYYLMCMDCPQTWVARRIAPTADTDLDRAPPLTCTTPAASRGQWEWKA